MMSPRCLLRCFLAASILAAGGGVIALPGPARAAIIISTPPTFGAFVSGAIGGVNLPASNEPGTGTNTFYEGTDYNVVTNADSAANLTASDSLSGFGDAVSASSDLASGNLSINLEAGTATITPGSLAAIAAAGLFVEMQFTGGQGDLATVTMSGTATYSGNPVLFATANVLSDPVGPMFGAPNPVGRGVDAPITSIDWSVSTSFYIEDAFPMWLSAGIEVYGLPGSEVTMSDPLSLNLPTGVTFTASDPGFLSGAPVPEPASLALFGTTLVVGLGAVRRRRRKPA